MWGLSSDGRALRSHRRGQGFDSPRLHQNGTSDKLRLFRFFVKNRARLRHWSTSFAFPVAAKREIGTGKRHHTRIAMKGEGIAHPKPYKIG